MLHYNAGRKLPPALFVPDYTVMARDSVVFLELASSDYLSAHQATLMLTEARQVTALFI